MRSEKKFSSLVALLAGTWFSVVAASPAVLAQTPARGGDLVFADNRDLTTWEPNKVSGYVYNNVFNQIFDRLVYFDADTNTVVPWLASEFAVNDKATEFKFKIREGVTFSDGSKLTSEVIKQNLDLLGLGNAALGIAPVVSYRGYQETILGPDDNTLTVVFANPNSHFLRILSSVESVILGPATLSLSAKDRARPKALVGSGPFVFDSEIPNQRITLKRRDGYAWAPKTSPNQGEAYLDSVVIRASSEESVRTSALLSGDVQLARGIQPTDEKILLDAGFKIIPVSTYDLQSYILALRAKNPLLTDVRVRQALLHATNTEEIVKGVLTNNYRAAVSPLNHGQRGQVDLSADLKFDPARSASLLDEAGWKLNGKGIREKDGVPLVLAASGSSETAAVKQVFDLIAQQWAKLGVVFESHAGDNAYHTAAYKNSAVPLMGIRGFTNGGLEEWYGQRFTPFLVYTPDELQALFDKERAATTEQEQLDLIAQEQKYLVEQALAIPLFDEIQVYGAANKVNGLTFAATSAPNFQTVWLGK